MNGDIGFCADQASSAQITEHFHVCNAAFIPPLSERVVIDDYVHKIVGNAVRFEAWADGKLVGLVAAYSNNVEGSVAFITSVSVAPGWQGKGIASQLVQRCIEHATSLGFVRIELEVSQANAAATNLYRKHGFLIDSIKGNTSIMSLTIKGEIK